MNVSRRAGCRFGLDSLAYKFCRSGTATAQLTATTEAQRNVYCKSGSDTRVFATSTPLLHWKAAEGFTLVGLIAPVLVRLPY